MRLGSQCFTNPEFVGTLLDGDKHDVAYPYNTAQQGKDTDHPNGGTKKVTGRLLLQVLAESVPYPYRTSVFCVELFGFRDFRKLRYLVNR